MQFVEHRKFMLHQRAKLGVIAGQAVAGVRGDQVLRHSAEPVDHLLLLTALCHGPQRKSISSHWLITGRPCLAQIHLTGANEREDGSYVNVYFAGTTSDGKNGDNAVTYGLAQVTHDILTATPNEINYVNVYATTNGVHTTDSDHAVGDAVDINQVNGESISGAGKSLGLALEAQALADPNTRYVEGPGGNWMRSSSGDTWQRAPDLPTQNNHVHWSTFRH